ncbi:hypothetical protein [Nocardioides marmorisolisilvae]|uniref:Uncharacterized protein n=1 Tax=Nocardioides marmorisolisilvae TaxID=1542737 RepID=A0A3N0DXG3_9ACTN|nr:hypothetical protein [Nocardioides marmorisolisilvae]RNL80143.1 hypothetical protein EFL95_14650 [Nocardioides marmorisolisilvae]
MSALPSPELLTSVRSAVYARLAQHEGAEGAYDRELLVTLCNEAITFSWTLSKRLPDGHVGQRARSAAALMLLMAYPEMRAGLRHQLAVACEIIAMGVPFD